MTAPLDDALPAPIVRHTGGRSLPAWRWHTLAQLRADTGWADGARDCVFADLALGPWRGHWLARQWAPQLGLPDPEPVQPALNPGEQAAGRHADTVGRLIDNESMGDVNFIAALDFAGRMLAALRRRRIRHVLVVAPLPGHAWGAENLRLLELLCDGAASHGVVLGLLLRGDAPAPDVPGFTFDTRNPPAAVTAASTAQGAIPGLLEAAWAPADARTETLILADGRRLLSPNSRPATTETTLAAGLPADLPPDLPAWLRVPFALCSCEQDVDFLQREAGLRFAEGGYELAYAILDGIRAERLTPLQAALVAAQKQNIAIALMDFGRAADGPVPDDGLPAEVRASLYQSKAWGLVMTGQPEQAEPWFARARTLLDPRRQRRLYLYLLNISALNKLRLGQPQQALAFEQEIERQLQDLSQPDWHLVYINCLNQARIHKKLGDQARAQQYYARGFHVTHQLRNESDLLYTDLCLAQLADQQRDPELAFIHWLRATLHWLSNPVPEALAPRVARAVLGRPLSNRQAEVEAVSAALAARLEHACGQRGLAPEPAARVVPLHRMRPGLVAERCVGQPGWSVLLSSRDHGPAPFDGPAHGALNRLAVGVLARLAPHADIAGAQAILTDDQDGIGLPASPREMLWCCLKWDVEQLDLAGRGYTLPARTDPAAATESARLLASYTVARSRAIDGIDVDDDGWEVRFKRYLAPRRLAPEQQACLAGLDRPLALTGLADTLRLDLEACMALVVRMAALRLVAVT